MRLAFILSCCALTIALGSHSKPALAEETGKSEKIRVFDQASLEVPAKFKRGKPKNSIVEEEFVAQAGQGDEAKTGRLYMMASGGSLQDNLARWQKQFTGGADKLKRKDIKIGNWDIIVAEVGGTYAESMGGGPFAPGRTIQRPDYAMLGAIIVAPDADNPDADPDRRRKYFVKMIGHKSIIETNREAFLQMIKSLKE